MTAQCVCIKCPNVWDSSVCVYSVLMYGTAQCVWVCVYVQDSSNSGCVYGMSECTGQLCVCVCVCVYEVS